MNSGITLLQGALLCHLAWWTIAWRSGWFVSHPARSCPTRAFCLCGWK